MAFGINGWSALQQWTHPSSLLVDWLSQAWYDQLLPCYGLLLGPLIPFVNWYLRKTDIIFIKRKCAKTEVTYSVPGLDFFGSNAQFRYTYTHVPSYLLYWRVLGHIICCIFFLGSSFTRAHGRIFTNGWSNLRCECRKPVVPFADHVRLWRCNVSHILDKRTWLYIYLRSDLKTR